MDEWIQAFGSGFRPTRKRGRNPVISGATRFTRGVPHASSNPNPLELCKVLEKAGCTYLHQEGDHVIYHKKGSVRPIVVPRYREIPEFIILKNLKTEGIERKTYFKLLGKK